MCAWVVLCGGGEWYNSDALMVAKGGGILCSGGWGIGCSLECIFHYSKSSVVFFVNFLEG